MLECGFDVVDMISVRRQTWNQAAAAGTNRGMAGFQTGIGPGTVHDSLDILDFVQSCL